MLPSRSRRGQPAGKRINASLIVFCLVYKCNNQIALLRKGEKFHSPRQIQAYNMGSTAVWVKVFYAVRPPQCNSPARCCCYWRGDAPFLVWPVDSNRWLCHFHALTHTHTQIYWLSAGYVARAVAAVACRFLYVCNSWHAISGKYGFFLLRFASMHIDAMHRLVTSKFYCLIFN